MNMNLELLLAEAEESSSGIDLLLPATSELVASIAAFAIVFFFIWKWALPALNETLESRASANKNSKFMFTLLLLYQEE